MQYVISGLAIFFVYAFSLVVFTKLSKIKYTQILLSKKNLLHGLVYPIGTICLVLLVFTISLLGLQNIFFPNYLAFVNFLWLIPFLLVVLTLKQFVKINKRAFQFGMQNIVIIGSLLVGISEELMFRGILVYYFHIAGWSTIEIMVSTSLMFGLLHGINYINGQDRNTTLMQIFSSTITGFAMFASLAVSQTLLLPIMLHTLFDLSLLLQGGELNHKVKLTKLDIIINLSYYLASVSSLIIIAIISL